ncbi:mucoidy inhibitor A [Parafrankia colletiae]|uniref:Mucoidy inhibitor A n=1 Tax=Parafrankia colletiae TaxID=573497 RepID=A0A1S1RJG9_9ACTN|nr:DUF4139 domain-containing protein [Parafrankia colletiae]MCK9899261.1 DUF4139 domain-containing protein [Frankia sp. Cpl3]OHV45929.1 mucoidy inhibitor A [Parafrankia colletiae]
MVATADDAPDVPGSAGAGAGAPDGGRTDNGSPGPGSGAGGRETAGPPAVVELDAPITAVVVYPTAARVTRRGRLDAAAHAARPAAASVARSPDAGPAVARVEVAVHGLPLGLDEDSVRVGGTGPARVLGVRVVSQARAVPDAGALADLRARQDELRALLVEIADGDETERARRSFLDVAARVGAGALARGWAAGSAGAAGDARAGAGAGGADAAAQLLLVGDALAAQIAAVYTRRRALSEQRDRAEKELSAIGRMIEARRAQPAPDTRTIVVDLELPGVTTTAGRAHPSSGGEPAAVGDAMAVTAAEAGELEVSYLVRSASWTSGYDARLEGERVTLTWFAMISQRTGEDWPAADLRLSTARPAGGADLPELVPQFVDLRRPKPDHYPRARGAAPGGAPEPAGWDAAEAAAGMPAAPMAARPLALAAPISAVQATLESAGAASTYRPPRPVAVPADGDPHRATVAVLELDAVLDHVTAPKLAAEAHLRAAVVNTSPHTLPAGKVSVFHGQEFVGTARLDIVPPGGEMELRLGVDDRVQVERELVRRVTGRRMVGNTRRTDVGYRIAVTNRAPLRARVTVRDQVPVSRHESIVVRDVVTEPAADEHTDLGLLTWQVELEPGASREIGLSYRLEHPRGAELTGWGD